MNREKPQSASRRQWLAQMAGQRAATRIGPLANNFQTDVAFFDQPMDDSTAQLAPLDLPPISEATLDRNDVRALFRDLTSFAADIQCHSSGVRPTSDKPPAESRESLIRLRDQLLGDSATSAMRVQIRYSWKGQRWIDTIERRESGFRLVRIAHPMSS